jgi:hypothetical protein
VYSTARTGVHEICCVKCVTCRRQLCLLSCSLQGFTTSSDTPCNRMLYQVLHTLDHLPHLPTTPLSFVATMYTSSSCAACLSSCRPVQAARGPAKAELPSTVSGRLRSLGLPVLTRLLPLLLLVPGLLLLLLRMPWLRSSAVAALNGPWSNSPGTATRIVGTLDKGHLPSASGLRRTTDMLEDLAGAGLGNSMLGCMEVMSGHLRVQLPSSPTSWKA